MAKVYEFVRGDLQKKFDYLCTSKDFFKLKDIWLNSKNYIKVNEHYF